MKGILNIYKPSGITSTNVVSKVKKILNTKSVGHMGTLDPQGEGVLLIGVGKATRLFDLFLNHDKIYIADFQFGYETDTLDKDGKSIKKGGRYVKREEILNILPCFLGEIDQVPPLYSAKSIGGQRAYDLARKGIDFELKPSRISIFNIDILDQLNSNTFRFKIHCSSGTYIRSICRDIAYSLNTYATMVSIKRVKAGNFEIIDSISLETLENKKNDSIIPLEKVLEHIPRLNVPDNCYQKLLNGIKINIFDTITSPFAVYCRNELFGIGKIEDSYLKISSYLRD